MQIPSFLCVYIRFYTQFMAFLHINNSDASSNCCGILMPTINESIWHKSSCLTEKCATRISQFSQCWGVGLFYRTWAKREKKPSSLCKWEHISVLPLWSPPSCTHPAPQPGQCRQVGVLACASKPQLCFHPKSERQSPRCLLCKSSRVSRDGS